MPLVASALDGNYTATTTTTTGDGKGGDRKAAICYSRLAKWALVAEEEYNAMFIAVSVWNGVANTVQRDTRRVMVPGSAPKPQEEQNTC